MVKTLKAADLIDEIRQVRKDIMKKCDNDIHKLLEYLRNEEIKGRKKGRKYVSLEDIKNR